MPEAGFLAQKPRSPTSLVVVILAHAAVLTALALSKMEMPVKVFTPIKIRDVIEKPPPPEVPPEPKQRAPELPKSVVDRVIPIIPDLPRDDAIVVPQPRPFIPYDPGPSGTADSIPVDPPKPLPRDPVRTEAEIDSRSGLQPDYPAAEERAQVEGSVTVRVLIGADGRVKSVERVRSASDAFFRATERQALRHWRFKPATIDGRPVESRKTITVHFRLDG